MLALNFKSVQVFSDKTRWKGGAGDDILCSQLQPSHLLIISHYRHLEATSLYFQSNDLKSYTLLSNILKQLDKFPLIFVLILMVFQQLQILCVSDHVPNCLIQLTLVLYPTLHWVCGKPPQCLKTNFKRWLIHAFPSSVHLTVKTVA